MPKPAKPKQFCTTVYNYQDVQEVLNWGVKVVAAFQIPGTNFITLIYE